MNKQQAQDSAIQIARNKFHTYAVIHTRDGENWQPGSHPEDQYLQTFFDGKEIWIADRHEVIPQWECYLSPKKKVDYVAETGATGGMADMLRNLMEALDED